MMIIAGIICFLLVLVWDLHSDYGKWKRNKPVNHESESAVRVLLLLPSMLMMAMPVEGHIVCALLLSWAMIGFTYWTLFDGLYNVIRRYPWSFTGSVDKDDAVLDKLQRNWKGWPLLKVVVSIALIATYTIIIL